MVIGASSSSMINESTYISSPFFGLLLPIHVILGLGCEKEGERGAGPKEEEEEKGGKRTGTQKTDVAHFYSPMSAPPLTTTETEFPIQRKLSKFNSLF